MSPSVALHARRSPVRREERFPASDVAGGRAAGCPFLPLRGPAGCGSAAAALGVVSPCGRQGALRLSRRGAGAPAACGAVGARAAPSRSAQSSAARPHRPRAALHRSAAPASRGVGRGGPGRASMET